MKLGVRELCVVKCGFSIVVSQEGRQNTYRIKTLNQYHKCGTMFSNKNAKTSWVAKHFLERLKCNPKMSVTNVIDDMRIRFAIKITTFVVTKARKLTLDIVSGHAKKQYLKLRDYFKELISACKSNTCEIMIDISNPTIEPRFGKFYVCYNGCKKTFQQTCRPFVGIDGCHLKNQFGGIMLVVVARDANEQNLPLALLL